MSEAAKVQNLPVKQKPRTKAGGQVAPLVPQNIEEAWQMAQYFSISGVVPSSYPGQRGSDENVAAVFGAMQMGATVGLPPIVAIANIMVVNGKFAMYGDSQLAVVRDSGELEKFKEFYEGEDPTGKPLSDWPNDFKAVCIVKRHGEEEDRIEFSVGDARTANLWMKTGSRGPTPWVTSPKRMLKYRARGFALRDHFSDVLLGLQHTAEELIDGGDLVEQEDGSYAAAPAEEPKREDYADSVANADAIDAEHEPVSEEVAAEPEPEDERTFTCLDRFGEDSLGFEIAAASYVIHMREEIGRCASGDELDALLEFHSEQMQALTDEEAAEVKAALDGANKRLRANAVENSPTKGEPLPEPPASEEPPTPEGPPPADEDPVDHHGQEEAASEPEAPADDPLADFIIEAKMKDGKITDQMGFYTTLLKAIKGATKQGAGSYYRANADTIALLGPSFQGPLKKAAAEKGVEA